MPNETVTWKLYNETDDITLELDTVQDIDTGLPSRVIELEDTLSNDFIMKATGNFEKRVFSVTKVFLQYAKADERRTFLKEFLRPVHKDIYLYKTIVDDDGNSLYEGRAKCYPKPSGGEGYTNAGLSDAVSFSVECETPYFVSTTETDITETIATKGQYSITVDINGDFQVPCQWTITVDTGTGLDYFRVANYEGDGVLTDFSAFSISAGDDIIIDTREGKITTQVNDSTVSNVTSANSSPFPLDTGSQTISVYAPAGTLTITYNERRV